MTDTRRLLLSRRDLLKYGGLTATAAAAAGLGPRLVGTILQPGRALAVDRPPDLKLVGTDGWISLPPDPSVFSSSLGVTTHPDSYAPDGRTTYIFGFANASGLGNDHPVQPEEQGPALGPAVLGAGVPGTAGRVPGPADQRRPGPAARPVRRAHPPLARLQERDPVLRRRADRLSLGPAGADVHLRLPVPRPRHLHVPLPRRGHGARPHGDDRPGSSARPRRLGLGHRTLGWGTRTQGSSPTTTATARRASTASTRCSSARCGRTPTGPTPTSSCRSGATTGPTSAC